MIIDKDKIKKILILRSDGIGDFILSLPALNILRTAFSNAYICLFTGSWQEELARSTKIFDEIIIWDLPNDYYFTSSRKIKYLSYRILRYIPNLRSSKFDLAIDFRNDDFRNRLIMWLSQAKIRLGFNRGGLEFLLTSVVCDREGAHKSGRFLELIRPIVGVSKSLPYGLNISEENIMQVDDFLSKEGIFKDDLIVVMHPVARWPAKAWPKEKFAKLSQMLLDIPGVKVIFIGVGEDLPAINEIRHMMIRKLIISAGRMSFMETAALIKKAKIFIGNDAAPMQMAAMLGIPTIGLFGPTEPSVFGPQGIDSRSIRKINEPCHRCSRKYCFCPDNFCMDKISVGEVYLLVKEFLPQGSTTRNIFNENFIDRSSI